MKTIVRTAYMLFVACFFASSLLFAKPERIQVESKEAKTRKVKAKALAKAVDLSAVEDPEARKALQAIFDSINLKSKK